MARTTQYAIAGDVFSFLLLAMCFFVPAIFFCSCLFFCWRLFCLVVVSFSCARDVVDLAALLFFLAGVCVWVCVFP